VPGTIYRTRQLCLGKTLDAAASATGKMRMQMRTVVVAASFVACNTADTAGDTRKIGFDELEQVSV
jgi:hypothetical protein